MLRMDVCLPAFLGHHYRFAKAWPFPGRPGLGVGHPGYQDRLAEAYGKAGQLDEGLGVLADALALVQKTGEGRSEAELYRLKGELMLQQSVQGLEFGVKKAAEECFWKAIEVARRSAKAWELRAVLSLSQLWQQQGKQKE